MDLHVKFDGKEYHLVGKHPIYKLYEFDSDKPACPNDTSIIETGSFLLCLSRLLRILMYRYAKEMRNLENKTPLPLDECRILREKGYPQDPPGYFYIAIPERLKVEHDLAEFHPENIDIVYIEKPEDFGTIIPIAKVYFSKNIDLEMTKFIMMLNEMGVDL